MIQRMKPEQTRREQFTACAAILRERFQSGILSELQPLPQWVVWKRSFEDNAWRKPPFNPNYRNARASSKIPKSWGTLDAALTALASGNFQGLGFVVTPQDPYCYIDLDQCVNLQERSIAPRAREIIQSLNSYTELSPSGTGLHILVRATLPASGIHTDIEMYDSNHYVTITTQHLRNTPRTIETRQEEVIKLYHEQKSEGKGNETRTLGGVDELVATAPLTALPAAAEQDRLLQQLLHGETSAFSGDESRADFVLIMKLLHWTGDNIQLTKELFMQSGLYREEKMQYTRGGHSYLEMTIWNVLRKRRNPPQRR